uniref:Zinc finger protein n=1 Tax=Loa loa TaxID=7209 RepID=A0A1I7V758_LOALO
MDESLTQSPEKQTPASASVTSAISTVDDDDVQVAEITVQIELKGKESTANN